jgi:hypothetical protein
MSWLQKYLTKCGLERVNEFSSSMKGTHILKKVSNSASEEGLCFMELVS